MEQSELLLGASEVENLKLPDPYLLIFYQDLKDRHIWLAEEIGPESCNYITQYIQRLNRTEADDMTPITLHIMSNGGSLSTMFAMYYTIKNSKIPVHTINEGDCHSAAVLIFLAGHKRSINPGATFVLHEGSAHMAGSHRETKAAMEMYNKDVEKMRSLIAKETDITLEELTSKFEVEQDWYVDYDLALQKGFVK